MEDEGGTQKSLEVRVSAALRSRLNDFKSKADTLTLEGVRRVLEKDLGLKTMELDSHKKFIKQCMDKHFYGPTESTNNAEEESSQLGRHAELQNKLSQSEDGNGKGLSDLSKDAKKTSGVKSASLDEDVIKKAIRKHATYFRENSGNITMAGVRRLLEGDLKIETKSLDKYKDFISKQLDETLSSEVVEPSNGTDKNKIKKSASSQEGKKKKKSESTSGSDQSGNSEDLSDLDEADKGSDDSDGEEVEVKKMKKRNAREQNEMSGQVSKKQKTSSKTSVSSSGRKKAEEQERSNDSEDSLSDSMIESSKKKKETPTPVYGKKVEHLKSVIKACGMSVPPSLYTKAKQAPDNKREAFMIKELEGILEKEGLSRNPSEKEIKAVRKKKERAKELEGIDLSNIVSSSRRRTTASFVPPKPTMPIDESEEEEDEEDEEDTDDENSQSGGSSEGSEEEEETSD